MLFYFLIFIKHSLNCTFNILYFDYHYFEIIIRDAPEIAEFLNHSQMPLWHSKSMQWTNNSRLLEWIHYTSEFKKYGCILLDS